MQDAVVHDCLKLQSTLEASETSFRLGQYWDSHSTKKIKKDKLPVACPCLSKPRQRDKTTAVCDRFCNGCQLQDSWRSAFQRSMRSMWSTSPAKLPIVCSRLRISYEFSNSADAPCLILSLFSVEPKDLSGQSRHSLEWSTSYHDSSRFRRITLHAICRAFCRFIQIYGI